MKKINFLVIALLARSPFAQANLLKCTTEHGPSFFVETSGTHSLKLQISRDTYEGTYAVNDEPEEAKLPGDKILGIDLGETDGCWPGSSFNINLVIFGPDLDTASGKFEMRDETGEVFSGGDVNCKMEGETNSPGKVYFDRKSVAHFYRLSIERNTVVLDALSQGIFLTLHISMKVRIVALMFFWSCLTIAKALGFKAATSSH